MAFLIKFKEKKKDEIYSKIFCHILMIIKM